MDINNELMELTETMTKSGGWELDIIKNSLSWTKEVYKIHEVEDSYVPNLKDGINFYYGKSKEKITEVVNDAINEGKPFDEELQLKTAKGNIIWVRSLGKAIKENDKVVKIFGTFQDITDIKKTEMALKEKNDQLEAVNKLMVGRELVMVELKNKISELEKKLAAK